MARVSRTVGTDQVVDELVITFTHDRPMDILLPGITPTGRRISVPFAVVVKFEDDKIVHEHIYWDQATVLVQAGLLDPAGLPVTGADQSRGLLDRGYPKNHLLDEGSGPGR